VKLTEISEKSYYIEEGFWCGNPRVGDHFEDPGVDIRIILRWLFRKWVWGYGLD